MRAGAALLACCVLAGVAWARGEERFHFLVDVEGKRVTRTEKNQGGEFPLPPVDALCRRERDDNVGDSLLFRERGGQIEMLERATGATVGVVPRGKDSIRVLWLVHHEDMVVVAIMVAVDGKPIEGPRVDRIRGYDLKKKAVIWERAVTHQTASPYAYHLGEGRSAVDNSSELYGVEARTGRELWKPTPRTATRCGWFRNRATTGS